MRDILIFGEDYGHELVATNLIQRVTQEAMIPVRISVRSCRGGYGAAVEELGSYTQDILSAASPLPDMLLVVADANCKGLNARKAELEKVVPDELSQFAAYVVADPHIERWLLLDSHAFRRVLGKGCKAPDKKCERDRYKRLLSQSVADAGVTPQLGGLEYVEDLVEYIDLQKVSDLDSSFKKAIDQLRGFCNRWSEPGG